MFNAIWKFFTFRWLRVALGIDRAADKTFTGSAQGVADAFDLHKDDLVHDANQLMTALADFETSIQEMRQQLKTLQEEKASTDKAVQGALVTYEKETDAAKKEEIRAKGTEFSAESARLAEEITKALADIAAEEEQGKDIYKQLEAMEEQIKKLPVEKAKAVAKYVSKTRLIEAKKKMLNLVPSADRGPLDAVQAKLNQLDAEAAVVGKLAHSVNHDARAEFIKAGEQATATSDFDKLIAQRAADKAKGDQAVGDAAPVATDRPKI